MKFMTLIINLDCITLTLSVIVRECGQTWTKVRVKYYNY